MGKRPSEAVEARRSDPHAHSKLKWNTILQYRSFIEEWRELQKSKFAYYFANVENIGLTLNNEALPSISNFDFMYGCLISGTLGRIGCKLFLNRAVLCATGLTETIGYHATINILAGLKSLVINPARRERVEHTNS